MKDSKTETVSDNELIAQFMGQSGLTKIYRGKIVPYVPAYDALWDLLMPVVEKIASQMPTIKIPEHLEELKNGTHGSEPHIEVVSLSISSPIGDIYQAVIKYIHWFNSQSPTTTK